MLWEPKKCCCCVNLRTGSLAIGYLFLIGSSITIIRSIATLISGKAKLAQACLPLQENQQECIDDLWSYTISTVITSIILSIITIIFSSMLLFGIYKRQTRLFVPLMVMYAIQIGLAIVTAVVLIAVMLYFKMPAAVLIMFIPIMALVIFVETYFLLVIRAYYNEEKKGTGGLPVTHTAGTALPPYSDK